MSGRFEKARYLRHHHHQPAPARGAIRLARAASLILVSCGLFACGDAPPVSEVAAADLAAARAGGSDAFKRFCEQTRGKRVVWPLTVVQALRQFGDDYIESGLLLLDIDTPGDGTPDVATEIRPSQVKSFSPGQSIRLNGVLRGCEIQGTITVVRIETVRID